MGTPSAASSRSWSCHPQMPGLAPLQPPTPVTCCLLGVAHPPPCGLWMQPGLSSSVCAPPEQGLARLQASGFSPGVAPGIFCCGNASGQLKRPWVSCRENRRRSDQPALNSGATSSSCVTLSQFHPTSLLPPFKVQIPAGPWEAVNRGWQGFFPQAPGPPPEG